MLDAVASHEEEDSRDAILFLLLQQNQALNAKLVFTTRQLDLERMRRNHNRDVDTLRKKNHLLARERDTLRTQVRRIGSQLAITLRQLTDSPSAKMQEAFERRGRKIEALQRQLRERNLSDRW